MHNYSAYNNSKMHNYSEYNNSKMHNYMHCSMDHKKGREEDKPEQSGIKEKEENAQYQRYVHLTSVCVCVCVCVCVTLGISLFTTIQTVKSYILVLSHGRKLWLIIHIIYK